MKVLHVLDHSLPYLSAYSFRTSHIVSQQRAMGMTPIVLTAPGHEHFEEACEILQGVQHHRTKWPEFYFLPQPRFIPALRHEAYVTALARKITKIGRDCEIDVIHAHSPALNGLAARRAAKQLRKPLIYELRYYEQDAAVDSGQTSPHSLRYHSARWLEDRAVKQADLVVTNSASMRNELRGRGISSKKIIEAPEGVDTRVFAPRPPDQELVEQHRLTGKTIIGFIGSFYRYEGLERLLAMMMYLLRERRDIKLVLAGSGELEAPLRARIPREWQEHFVFTGRIEQEEILRYYSIMDICIYPRLSTRMTELTTSVRPLEAMAMEKAVIGGNVGGVAELIRHNKTGLVVETDDKVALSASVSYLANNPTERLAMGKRARSYVVAQRDWTQIAQRYTEIYQRVLSVEQVKMLAGIKMPEPEKERQGWSEGTPSESRTKF